MNEELTDELQLPTFLSGQAQLNDGSGFLRVSRVNDTMTGVLISRRAATCYVARCRDDCEPLQADREASQPEGRQCRMLMQREAPQHAEPSEAQAGVSPQDANGGPADVVQLLEGPSGPLQHGLHIRGNVAGWTVWRLHR